jgi:hypothetical protein
MSRPGSTGSACAEADEAATDSPREKVAMAHSDLRSRVHAIVDELFDAIEGAAVTEWVDQKTSPLGRERHTALVRSGALPGTKDGRRIMVRRADIDAYLAKRRVIKVDPDADEDREVQRIVAEMERKRRLEAASPAAPRRPRSPTGKK